MANGYVRQLVLPKFLLLAVDMLTGSADSTSKVHLVVVAANQKMLCGRGVGGYEGKI